MLAPLTNDDSRLRCVVVKTKPAAEASAASPANFTIDKAAPVVHLPTGSQTQASSALPPAQPEQADEKRRRGRVRSRNRSRTQQEEVASAESKSSSIEPNHISQVCVLLLVRRMASIISDVSGLHFTGYRDIYTVCTSRREADYAIQFTADRESNANRPTSVRALDSHHSHYSCYNPFLSVCRQEYEAFHALHYDVLKAWSKSDPDS